MGTLDQLQESSKVVVVMVPFPAQGHLNQLLHLTRLVSTYGLPVHYLTTASHSRQAKIRVHGWDPLKVNNVHFHELPIPQFPSPPPNLNIHENFPTHLQPVFNASILLRQPITNILQSLSNRFERVVLIHDSLMSYVVQDFTSLPNAESYAFHSVSACTLFFFMWERMGKPFGIDPVFLKELPSMEGCFSLEFIKFVNSQHEYTSLTTGKIYNTSHVVEKQFIELLAREEIGNKGKKQWALGPFNPLTTEKRTLATKNTSRHESLKWLDKQDPNSVLYISFGTTTSFSVEQINEISNGLLRSEQKFVWVAREADRGDIFNIDIIASVVEISFPEEFETRVSNTGNGIIIRDWAPQLEILEHPATGGFLSHCGWNSCMESISMGVPVVAWPMHSDQPRNAFLISKILGIGLVVREWDKRKELVTSETVAKAVQRLMASKEGDEMRRRAAVLGNDLRQSVAEGGSRRIQLESFINHIKRSNS